MRQAARMVENNWFPRFQLNDSAIWIYQEVTEDTEAGARSSPR